MYLIFFSFFVFFKPELLNHSINYIHSNPLVTPAHIVPEWYFLPFYTILRSILQKEMGIIYMFLSIIVLFLLPKIDLKNKRIIVHNTLYKKFFWIFVFNFIFLGYLGAQTIITPVIELSLMCTWYYFYYLLFIVPILLKINTFTSFTIVPITKNSIIPITKNRFKKKKNRFKKKKKKNYYLYYYR